MVQAHGSIDAEGAGGRTPADVSPLLVELGRALKGWQFYPANHPARRDLLDRAWRAWQGELDRHGPLDLEIRRGAFWLAGASAPLAPSRGDDSARQLFVRSVRRVCFDASLDPASLAAFLDVLATDPDALAARGGFEAAYYTEQRQGVQVNEVDYRALREQLQQARSEDAAAPAPAAGDEPAPSGDASPAAETEAGESLDGLLDLLGAATRHALEETPLEADPRDTRALELVERLRELEECRGEAGYRDLAQRVVWLASRLAADGVVDEGYRAVLVLALHASDDAKRSFSQRETALEALGRLATGAVLQDLIGRATAAGSGASLRAAEVLLQLGVHVVPVLLDQIEQETDPERRGRLGSLVIAMGEEACPALSDAILAGSRRRQRAALRLAGETQNPRIVPSLREALLAGSGEVARDAAQALVRIGDVAALEALAEALRSPSDEVAALAAYSLGTTGRVLAVGPLVEALARAIETGALALAREVVRGIGRLGRPEGVPALAGLLARGGLFRRRRLREVQLAAVSALLHLPGRSAEDALGRAASSRDARLREAATAALERRARDAGRP